MRPFLTLPLALLLYTCDSAPEQTTPQATKPAPSSYATIDDGTSMSFHDAPNPPAPGFNLAGSDPEAINIADSIVKYHGGRDTYDNTRYFSWNFFGARDLLWDKLEKRARIDVPQKNTVYLLDYSGDELRGRVRIKGNEITDPDFLKTKLEEAHAILINDSYWLVHQFKLKDSGVTLKFLPPVNGDPERGRPSFVIEQSFDAVGNTPQNRYRLYVDQETYHINTWQFFRDAEDQNPTIQTPWKGYVPSRGLLLSSDRGGDKKLNNIGVPPKRFDSDFTKF